MWVGSIYSCALSCAEILSWVILSHPARASPVIQQARATCFMRPTKSKQMQLVAAAGMLLYLY